MADLPVTTTFDAKGDIFKALKSIDKKVDKFGNSAQRAFRKANKGASSFKSAMSVMKGVIGANIISKGFNLIGRGIGSVATEFIGFDQAITSAAAKFKDVNLQTAEGRKKFEELKASARDTGATTEFSAGQAAQGLKFMSLAAFTSAQAMANLTNLTNFATSAEIDLARASDIATDSLGAFGLMTDDTAQLQKNFTRQNDVMALAMARSNVGAEDFFETVKRSGATFTATGQRLETFATLTGIMADAGKKGGDAGTVLNNMMLRLAKPTGDAAKAIDLLGIKTRDGEGNFRDIVDILADVKKGTADMGTAQRAAALDLIFGKRAITGVNILLQKGIPAIRGYREEMDNAAGSSEKMATIMRSSVQNLLAGLGSAAIEFGFKLITPFEKDIRDGITRLTEFIRTVDTKPFTDGIRTVIDKIKELKIDDFKGIGNLFDKISSIDLLSFEKFPERIATGIEGAVKGIDNFLIAFEKMWVKIEPIIDTINDFITDDPGDPTKPPSKVKKFKKQISTGFAGGRFGGLSGLTGDDGRNTPQQKEAMARAQQFTLNQNIDVNNAPAGTTVESKTTAAPQLAAAGGANIQFNGRF